MLNLMTFDISLTANTYAKLLSHLWYLIQQVTIVSPKIAFRIRFAKSHVSRNDASNRCPTAKGLINFHGFFDFWTFFKMYFLWPVEPFQNMFLWPVGPFPNKFLWPWHRQTNAYTFFRINLPSVKGIFFNQFLIENFFYISFFKKTINFLI